MSDDTRTMFVASAMQAINPSERSKSIPSEPTSGAEDSKSAPAIHVGANAPRQLTANGASGNRHHTDAPISDPRATTAPANGPSTAAAMRQQRNDPEIHNRPS